MSDKVTSTTGKSRLNLRLPADLDQWVKKYAEDNNTTVTSLVVGYFTDLQKKKKTGDEG